ncbi:MAG: right-handed parallel beta-helix repeat-containing protein [Sedimentisphaerales bacterium]|nr:right-handed parallel beta-helix repeat-containing protein [Sedimentisphaerales bacterium]
MYRLWLVALLLFAFTAQATGAVYYVDSTSGDDGKSGLSPRQAWKSLTKVNDPVFRPGDKVLFKRGTQYTGQLRPQGSGQQDNPIVLASYGTGPKPRIDGEGKVLDAVLVRNIEHWDISDLEVTNQGPERQPWRTGVRVVVEDYGTMRHIHLRGLYVHDVNGDLRKSHEGCGIFFEAKGGKDSHFDDLLIEDCHLVRTDRNGICQRRGRGAARSLGVVIRGNLLEDIGGDAIKPWGSNGALVEHNIVRGGRTRCDDYAAGIWPWDCDDTVIQFNEVSGMKGTKDGQAFDSDYRCRNTLFQYNYSHDNDGGFMLICSPGTSYCEGTVIRYNVSQNDGVNSARVFHFGGGPANTYIYNNVFYIGPDQDLPLLLFTEWDKGNARNTCFYNNIFYVAGKVRYKWGKSSNNVFESNVFYGDHKEPPADPRAIREAPPLLDPGGGDHGLWSVGGYQLREPAPQFVGRLIENNGGRDYFGNPVPKDTPPFVGIHQPRD